MHRFTLCIFTIGIATVCFTPAAMTQQPPRPELRKLSVPADQAKSIATKLNFQFRDIPGVQISPDVRNEQLVVMAPEGMQHSIATEVRSILTSDRGDARVVTSAQPVNISLKQVSWRQFEDDLQRLVDHPIPITTTQNGQRAAFQLTGEAMQGTTVEVDRQNNSVTVVAPTPMIPGWQKMIAILDQSPARADEVTEIFRLIHAEPAPIQQTIRLLRNLKHRSSQTIAAKPLPSPFRNAVFQQDAATGSEAGDNGAAPADGDTDLKPDATGEESGSGLIGETQIQIVPELGTIIIKGPKRDVQRVMDVIKQIEDQSEITKPDIDVVELQHTDSNAVATLLKQLYEDVLSARQGEVSITSLDSPNALLLIGRTEAIKSLMDLIAKIDQPVAASNRLRIFRLQHASAVDAEQSIRDFFTDRPGTGDDLRPALGLRVRVLADYRTNSLIISAAPRDMVEVTRLINELDVQQITAQSQIKIFSLNNAIAEDLAPVLQSAINGEGEGGGNENITQPSTTLSIVSVDAGSNELLDSGILAGAVITADANANAIIVRAPAASMPLIGELIRQLDRAPGIESLVKVFTIQNGDALKLTAALQDLFGSEAASSGTSVGAANLAGLPPTSAGIESSLVPLRFSTDQRTNSIIASGSAEDLEVVESILLRLDSEGFADRITEVIWLRHQTSDDVATALQTYVQQRTQTVTTIQQFQQGLGPFDLPDRDLIVVSEPVSNSILLSVSPRLYEDVRRLIDRLDRRPPMVLIKVMIAEVRLDDTFEIGGEVGLQDSLVYDRGVAAGAIPGADPPSVPGFNFNGNGLPTANSFSQGTIGSRGVSNFGVGTTSSALGYGGFVLSAASDSMSLLLRTLQEANRLQILSRPQIMTMDNTEGTVRVGRKIARVTGVINNGVAGTQVVTEDVDVGLIMIVRPRVGSDGLIIMDIDATRSDRDPNNGTAVPTGTLGGVVVIDDILDTTAQSVVAAYSGQTVIFGGLIQKTRANISRRVPVIADIPLIGNLFKFDRETETRSELLVIMTPMLVTGEEDLDYVKQVESSRMSWCLADVVEAHGDVGLSGGNGLWGPAVANTIYPDLQPTIENVVIGSSYPVGGSSTSQSRLFDHSAPLFDDDGAIIDPNSVMDVMDVPGTDTPTEPFGTPMDAPMVVPMSPPMDAPTFPPMERPTCSPLASPTVPLDDRIILAPEFLLPDAMPKMGPPPRNSSVFQSALPSQGDGDVPASQVSWIDVMATSESASGRPVKPALKTKQDRPKPIRLGANDDGMLTSD